MTTYKGINGTAVQNYAGNIPNPVDGQVWYDSTNADFKYQYVNLTTAGAWSTGGNMNVATRQAAGAGTQDSSLVFGGESPSAAVLAKNESYNGSAWTEVADLNTAKGTLAGAGVDNTSALAFGGATGSPADSTLTTQTEDWNGSAWTEVNDLNAGRWFAGGFGTKTSASFVGGGSSTWTEFKVPGILAGTRVA